MAGQIAARLKELGIVLPTPAKPAANYVPFVLTGQQLFISGQLPMGPDGPEFIGTLGDGVNVETGQQAARLCAINILAQAQAALGDLDRIEACVKVGGFVHCTPDFVDHPAVVNGASDLLGDVLGEKGRHARFAVGCANLPFGVTVEVDALFAIT